MKTRVLLLIAALGLTVGLVTPLLTGCGDAAHRPAAKARHYRCPMHPGVTSDKPGDCPICGMKLVPFEPGQPAAEATTTKRVRYRSTMNPQEVSDRPGQDSMGRAMVAFAVTTGAEPTPAGLATVSITPAVRERMGLTIGTVEKRDLSRVIRTSARIVADEMRLYHVTVKVEGYVEKLFVAVTGQAVKKDEPLMAIYSPDLVAAEQEYLIALQTRQKLQAASASGPAPARPAGDALVRAARQRLELWDVSAAQIERLEKTGEVEKVLTLYSPVSGWVVQREIAAGHKVMPGEVLLSINDFSNVWGDADIYESDLAYVKVGMPVELALPYWPDKTFKGQVFFVSPTLDPETRTMKARLTIPNPDLLLKPEMYANARLSYALGERLLVPKSAVLRTGEHSYVFRAGAADQLTPVEIKLGVANEDSYEVLSGLQAGDRVVTSANFLVDSESSMQAALKSVTP